MGKTSRLELRIEPRLMTLVDEARGDVSRTRWVERALESALGEAEDLAGIPAALERSRRAGPLPGVQPSSRAPEPVIDSPVGAPATRQEVAGSTPAKPVSSRRVSPDALRRQAELNKAKGMP